MECEYEEKQGEAVLKLARDQIASGDPVAALQVRQHGPELCRQFLCSWIWRPQATSLFVDSSTAFAKHRRGFCSIASAAKVTLAILLHSVSSNQLPSCMMKGQVMRWNAYNSPASSSHVNMS